MCWNAHQHLCCLFTCKQNVSLEAPWTWGKCLFLVAAEHVVESARCLHKTKRTVPRLTLFLNFKLPSVCLESPDKWSWNYSWLLHTLMWEILHLQRLKALLAKVKLHKVTGYFPCTFVMDRFFLLSVSHPLPQPSILCCCLCSSFAMSKTAVKKLHWRSNVQDTFVPLLGTSGELGVSVGGGADYGEFPFITSAPGGGLTVGDIVLEIGGTPLLGMTLGDVRGVLNSCPHPIRIKTVSPGRTLQNKDNPWYFLFVFRLN